MRGDGPDPAPDGRRRLWLYVGGLSICWGSAFPLIRYVAQELDPFTLAAMRATLAAVALALFLLAIGARFRLDRALITHMLVLGVVNGTLPNILTGFSLARIDTAPASLIQASGPLIVATLATLVLREERMSLRFVGGLLLGFLGIAIIIGPLALAGARSSTIGALCMVATAASYAIGTIYARRVRVSASAPLVLGQQICSAVPAWVLVGFFGSPQAWNNPIEVWAALALLAVIASAIPLTLYIRLLSFARATDASMVGYLQPVVAILLATLLLAEFPEWRVLAGGAVVLAGVALVSSRRPLAG